MNKAAETVYTAIRRDGHQKNVVDTMQTREELYERIGYHEFEQKLDALFAAQVNAMIEPARNSRRPHDRSTDARFKPKKSVALSRHRRRQHRAVHRRPQRQRPALPRLRHPGYRRQPASSKKSPTCWCTASCPTAPNWPATRPSCKSLRGLPGQLSRRRWKQLPPSAHPMDVMRTGVSVLGCVLPEKDDHNHARRARHRRPPDGLARLDAAVLVPLQPQRQAHRVRNRRRLHRRPLPAPAARQEAARARGSRRCTPR